VVDLEGKEGGEAISRSSRVSFPSADAVGIRRGCMTSVDLHYVSEVRSIE
jgi:hypothetical protein